MPGAQDWVEHELQAALDVCIDRHPGLKMPGFQCPAMTKHHDLVSEQVYIEPIDRPRRDAFLDAGGDECVGLCFLALDQFASFFAQRLGFAISILWQR